MNPTKKELLALVVNETSPGKCWCLGCDKKHANTTNHMGVWWNSGKLICTYWVCPSCDRKLRTGTRAEKLKLAHTLEDEIVVRYPHIIDRLPDDWRDDRYEK
jgi:hypothetical protein